LPRSASINPQDTTLLLCNKISNRHPGRCEWRGLHIHH